MSVLDQRVRDLRANVRVVCSRHSDFRKQEVYFMQDVVQAGAADSCDVLLWYTACMEACIALHMPTAYHSFVVFQKNRCERPFTVNLFVHMG